MFLGKAESSSLEIRKIEILEPGHAPNGISVAHSTVSLPTRLQNVKTQVFGANMTTLKNDAMHTVKASDYTLGTPVTRHFSGSTIQVTYRYALPRFRSKSFLS